MENQPQSLRNLGDKLRVVTGGLGKDINILSQLELDIVREAFLRIANRGMEILVSTDPRIYDQDLKRVESGEGSEVYLLCDENGHLQDIGPLLEFVSPIKRANYEKLRDDYLGGE